MSLIPENPPAPASTLCQRQPVIIVPALTRTPTSVQVETPATVRVDPLEVTPLRYLSAVVQVVGGQQSPEHAPLTITNADAIEAAAATAADSACAAADANAAAAAPAKADAEAAA